jgi:hypothetical protein
MPAPSAALSRPDLESSFQEFDTEARDRGFIADQVLPPMPVNKVSSSFLRIPVEALLAERDTERASGGTYARQKYKFEEDSYDCKEQGAEEVVDDRDAAIYKNFFQAEVLATGRARSAVMINREKRVAAAIFNTSTWTGATLTTALSSAWSGPVSSQPVQDVQAAAEKIFEGTGLIANALVINRKVLQYLRNCDEVVERLKYSSVVDVKKITIEALAEMLFPDVPGARLIVAGAPRNTLNAGQASVSMTRIWSDSYAMVCRVSDSSDLSEPCLGRSLHFVSDGSELPCKIETYRDDTIRADIVRCRHDVSEKVLYAGAGHLLTNIA